ncbi:MAG: FAD-dependent oxidoreductase, partial [Pseudomonadota bacterium]
MSRPSARPAPRIVVIGAGFGGLSAALRLAAAGQDVTVVERTATVGGKARQVSVGGHGVAGGPTVFTMRWVFDALFAEAGSSTEAELALTRAHVLARHAWPDGSRFDLMADAEATVEGIRAFAGDAEATRYARFARETERAFRLFRHSFIEASRPSPLDIVRRLGPVGSAELLAVRPAASMWRVLCARLRDPRLRQLFGRYATYCGSSPFRAPATLTLIAHVEQLGVWTVAGGMQAVAGRLARLIERHGGRLRLGTGVARIEVAGGRAAAVILEDGTRIAADAVVFNGDAGALGAGLLGGDVRRASPAT